MARITENGLEIDGIPEIRRKLNEAAEKNFEKYLNGLPLQTDDSSVLGRIFGIVSESLALQEELLQDVYARLDPNQVSDDTLDDFLYLSGDYRTDSAPSIGLLHLYGNIGTSVNAGASAKSPTTGDIYVTNERVTFNNMLAYGVGIKLKPTPQSSEYSLTYSIEGTQSVNPPVVIVSYPEDDEKSLAVRFAQTINNQTSYIFAEVTKGNVVRVMCNYQSDVGSFDVSGDMSIVTSYKPVEATSRALTAVGQLSASVTQISGGATEGWLEVTNPFAILPSIPVEDDSSARYNWRLSKLGNSFGGYDRLRSAISQVKGVKFKNIQQNISSRSNGERINQGVSIVVQGGNGQELAQTIFETIGCGTATTGTESYVAVDSEGGGHTIRFSRPKSIPIKITMSLKALPNFPTNGKNMIKQAIVDYFNQLNVGEDILYSRLFDPINRIDGFSVRDLKIGKVGSNITVQDIVLKYNELAVIKESDIIIGGS